MTELCASWRGPSCLPSCLHRLAVLPASYKPRMRAAAKLLLLTTCLFSGTFSPHHTSGIALRISRAAITALFIASSVSAQPRVSVQQMRDVFPADAKVEQFVITRDGRRTYYTTPTGGLWLYDRETKAAARVSDALVWDVDVSTTGNAVAYTKMGNDRRQQFVWVLPIAANSGLAAAPERRVSASPGDVPAISPDGKWIAFARDDATGVGQSIVVAPTGGGMERVVAPAQPAGIRNIRWTLDGNALYFGVNTPVPFTCAESCLSLARDAPGRASIRRVAVAGGTVTIVALTNSPVPGLSPDGTMLVYGDTAKAGRLLVSDAQGKRLDTLTLPAGHIPVGWSNAYTLLTLTSGTVRRLGAIPLGTPAIPPRVLFETADVLGELSLAPDGQTVAVTRLSQDGAELHLINRDGKAPLGIRLRNGSWRAGAWTADQKWMVFRHFPLSGPPTIGALELSTGNTKDLRELAGENSRFVVDGQTVIVAEPGAPQGGKRSTALWQVGLNGQSSLLTTLTRDTSAVVIPVNKMRALVRVDTRQFHVVDIASGTERPFLKSDDNFTAGWPSYSADKQWVAFRLFAATPGNPQTKLVELVRLDGSARRSVELPMIAEAMANNPAILPGANALVVVERQRTGVPPGLFLVDAATRAATKLLQLPMAGRLPEIVLSSDGRTLLYLVSDILPSTVSAVDFTLLRTVRRP